MILNNENKQKATDLFSKIIDMGINFKLQEVVREKQLGDKEIKKILGDLPEEPISVENILSEFEEDILPYCTNFSSKR